MTDALRGRFEDWAVSKRELDVTPTPNKEYGVDYWDIITEDHWKCWQAAQPTDTKIEELARQIYNNTPQDGYELDQLREMLREALGGKKC